MNFWERVKLNREITKKTKNPFRIGPFGLFKLIKNRRVFNNLGFKYVEEIEADDRFLVKKPNIIWEVIKFLIIMCLLVFFIILTYIDISFIGYFYRYSFGILFGNSIIIIGFLVLISMSFHILSLVKPHHAFSYFSRIRKVNVFTLKKQINIFLILLFFIVTLSIHLNHYYSKLSDFEFSPSQKNLFHSGWWELYKDGGKGPNVQNNLGVILDSIYNCLYYLSVSSLVPILIVIGLSLFAILKLFLIDIRYTIKMFLGSDGSLKSIVKNYESRNFYFLSTANFKKYTNFIYFVARKFNGPVDHKFVHLQLFALNESKKINFAAFQRYYQEFLDSNKKEKEIPVDTLRMEFKHEDNVPKAKNEPVVKIVKEDVDYDLKPLNQESEAKHIEYQEEYQEQPHDWDDFEIKSYRATQSHTNPQYDPQDLDDYETESRHQKPVLKTYEQPKEQKPRFESDKVNLIDKDEIVIKNSAEEDLRNPKNKTTNKKVQSMEDFLKSISPIEKDK
ncbi:hypothetical protein C4M96_00865 [Mycoplasmopsis pullorum]|uniref:hypothetical protein n=1 Tax=Mycoplasmopsis pullorum TaxID=48003 RepID=UPI001118E341|nr:hypothetical protein [Mycoplasmopsis pullorum]TNK84032.1 hypothetical protein C4M93_00070 [Mycoplasmopsis pullorum]TNK92411.1 hypothetical protein C4M96_00865 [Mycoplasmopsis pullorum]